MLFVWIMEEEILENENKMEHSASDEEYNELCDAVQRGNRKLADIPGCGHDGDLEDEQSEEEELQDVDQQEQQTDNRHSDLVTPELSAGEKPSIPMPPKLSHKKSHKKSRPSSDKRKRSGRKLEYQSSMPSVPLHKARKRKLLPKTDPKLKTKQKRSNNNKKKQLQERTIHEDGTWVQCMHSECLKWRYLSDVTDPALIPEYWVCEMNTDPNHYSCEHPEEDYNSLEFVLSKFTEGSIVWAKMQGYPWWPAIVEADPNTGTYLEQENTDSYPTRYHVVFLDKNVSRTWLKSTFVRKYEPGNDEQTHAKGRDYKHQVSQAVVRANGALSMNVQDRIKTFGFSHTFKGKIVDSSQESANDEVLDRDADSDQLESDDDEDVDVELDLEILGLDVDDILEEAEALLSEAGETIQSLQDTPPDEEASKKTKRRRKSKNNPEGETCTGNTDKEGKTKRQYQKKSLKDVSGENSHKKKRKSHHHHSKKNSKEEKGIAAESKDDTSNLMDAGGHKRFGDIQASEPDIRSKIINEVGEDCSTKTKKQHVNKRCLFKEAAGNTSEYDAVNQNKKSDSDARTKEKKPRKPRVKKSDVEIESKANGVSAVIPKEKEPTGTSTPASESEKQESKKADGDIRPKVKKVRKPRIKKSEAGPEAKNQIEESENLEKCGGSDGPVIPKEKKVRKPRVKKLDGEVKPKAKKPRAKKFAAKLITENVNESDVPTEESEKDGRQNVTDSKPRLKKSRASKTSAAKKPPADSKTSTTEDKAQVSSSNQDDDFKAKANKTSKTAWSGPKMKPAFKPPTRKSKDVQTKTKKSSFAVSMERKDNSLSDKAQQKATTTDHLTSSKSEKQSSDDLITMVVEGSIERHLNNNAPKPDGTVVKTCPDDAVVSKRKAKPFSIKKKANPHPLAESISSAEIMSTDASSPLNQNRSPLADLARDAVCTFNQQPEKPNKNLSKKDTAKKFSIKHTTSVLKDSSLAPPQSALGQMDKTSLDADSRENPASKIKIGETDKPASKKLSIKRKSSSALGEGTTLKSEDNVKNSLLPSSKKLKVEQQEQPCVDDEESPFDLDEDLLDDDTILVLKDEQGDRVDAGEDSDDFSMEDLEDWAKDSKMADEPSQEDSKLHTLTTGTDADPQSFEIVEE